MHKKFLFLVAIGCSLALGCSDDSGGNKEGDICVSGNCNPDNPTPDKPTPDNPTPDNPTPDNPTPDNPTP
ncbi:MAG: hypothetical protein J6A01_10690, partial [Proteobacteria bacterium]|nr:hypothetical protein [Pseudomonadota bacterium]